MKRILLTGAMRSGTTLLEKLLSSHPQVCIYSQPLPLLYVDVKRSYLHRYHRCNPHYPLSDQFLGTYFPASEFLDFLRGHRIPAADLRKTLADQENYSGQRTDLTNYLPSADAPAMGLARTVDSALDWLESTEVSPREQVGSKEVFCEEFIPYFLDQGYRVLLMLRDPRDVLASSIAGQDSVDVGRERPILFLLRQWRNSVAYAIEHKNHRNFHYCRFEDLVDDPNPVLEDIYDFLRLPHPPRVGEGQPIVDQKGRPWSPNSSHRSQAPHVPGLNRRAMGSYRRVLEPEQTRFVEALTFPEMRWLSYTSHLEQDGVEGALLSQIEERDLPTRRKLADYRWCAARRDEEIDRWRRLLTGDRGEGFFPFQRVFDELSVQLSEKSC